MLIRFIVLFAIFAAPLAAYEASEEESLALRRIADFWQEGETFLAKGQMEQFIAAFPDSPYFDTLVMALGDLQLREKNYQLALSQYARIKEQPTVEKAFLNRMQCLYHLQWYATLADECEAHLKRGEDLQTTYLLAIALYQQCLNLEKEPDALRAMALRAKPHFETLAQSELSDEVAGAYAHLCCILKDYEAAAKAYLELAARSETPEEMRFQAALLQAKYDKNLSAATFDQLAKEGGARAQDAAYNQLVLAFEQERFEEIVASKEMWLKQATPERIALIHLLVGKSLLALKHYAEAALELGAFLDAAPPGAAERPAVLHLVEAAYRAGNLPLLERAIERLGAEDAQRPQALLQRFELLKAQGQLEQARAQLDALLTGKVDFPERAAASLERIALAASAKDWERCRTWATEFLRERPQDALAPYAWRYFGAAAMELGQNPEKLTRDLDALLEASSCLTPEEQRRWQFVRAKVDFERGELPLAAERLEALLAKSEPFGERANAELLLALCLRDDAAQFCAHAERALSAGATLLGAAEQRIALFNAYVGQNAFDKAAEHLLTAFFDKAEIQPANLLWLAEHVAASESAVRFLTALLERNWEPADRETLVLKLAKLHQAQGHAEFATPLLEALAADYAKSPTLGWAHQTEALLLLGELHAAAGNAARAEALFADVMMKSPVKRDRFSVAAALQAIRLRLKAAPDSAQNAAVQLKNLVLQKTLENEPLHLEAALDYVELQARGNPEKKLALFEKMRHDFVQQDDLLSRDYHAARARLEAQDHLYQAYMQYVDAEMCLAKAAVEPAQQKELQAKAKDLLLQIKEPLLQGRVQQRLEELR